MDCTLYATGGLDHLQADRLRRARVVKERTAAKICVDCGRNSTNEKLRCETCLERRRKHARAVRALHTPKKRGRKTSEELLRLHPEQCKRCTHPPRPGTELCEEHHYFTAQVADWEILDDEL